jgi:hypothetical protein
MQMKITVGGLLAGSAVAFAPASISRGVTQLAETKVGFI